METNEKKDLRTVISIRFIDNTDLIAFFDSVTENNFLCVTEPIVSKDNVWRKYFTNEKKVCTIPIQGNVRIWAESDEYDKNIFYTHIERWDQWEKEAKAKKEK
jgi:hypothetical protein